MQNLAHDISTDSNAFQETVKTLSTRVSDTVRARGHRCRPYSSHALIELGRASEEKQSSVIKSMYDFLMVAGDAEPVENPVHPDQDLFQSALKHHRMRLPHNFWNFVQPDQILEIYNLDNIQVWRSFNLFDTSAYSFLDLSAFEWFKLWERPPEAITSMLDDVKKVVSTKYSEPFKMAVPPHLLKEIANLSDEEFFLPRSILVTFDRMAPTFDVISPDINGFIVTSSAKIVTLGQEDTDKISFLNSFGQKQRAIK